MAGFAITSYLGATSLSAAPRKGQDIRRISYYDLVPSEDNFYSMDEIAALKASIELAGRVLHNLVVVPTVGDKYKILSGHRRHKAIGEMLAEGKDEYEFIPCTVEQLADDEDGIREQTLLIAANSQREKTAWDKLEEVRRMREIARKAKARDGVSGRVRDLVAQSLHVSASKVAKYDSILNNLIPALLDEIKADRLSISVAYELSTLPADQQQAQCDFFLEHGKLPARDVFRANTQPDKPQPVELPKGAVFRANTQPDKPQPSEQSKGDVFRANTQPDKPQPSDPPKGDVFRANTQPDKPQPSDPPKGDVFRANTQPDKPQPSDPPKGDVFHSSVVLKRYETVSRVFSEQELIWLEDALSAFAPDTTKEEILTGLKATITAARRWRHQFEKSDH